MGFNKLMVIAKGGGGTISLRSRHKTWKDGRLDGTVSVTDVLMKYNGMVYSQMYKK